MRGRAGGRYHVAMETVGAARPGHRICCNTGQVPGPVGSQPNICYLLLLTGMLVTVLIATVSLSD